VIQHKLKLTSEFSLTLKECNELWVAVALISDFGFDFLQEHLNKKATQHYLVGIGLPTSPRVLSQLKQLETENCNSKIHHDQDKFFHPKVYIIKTGKKLTAYVGSGNCTQGGLDKNLELTIKIDDEAFCNNLLTWLP
jgi:HKD family nuclease